MHFTPLLSDKGVLQENRSESKSWAQQLSVYVFTTYDYVTMMVARARLMTAEELWHRFCASFIVVHKKL